MLWLITMIFPNLNNIIDHFVLAYSVISLIIIFYFFAIEKANAPSLRKKIFQKQGRTADWRMRFNGLWVVQDIDGIDSWCKFTEQNKFGFVLFSMV
jgi:hypothetical protein